MKLNDPVRSSEIEAPVMPFHISYVEPFWEAQSSVGELVGLFVGGAVSIDRMLRKDGVSYWRNETFNFNYPEIKRCDILITHSAPTWNGPIDKSAMLTNFCERDLTLWDECMSERKQHDILIKLSGAKRHYCGHFHQLSIVDFDGCVSTILDELQIAEIS